MPLSGHVPDLTALEILLAVVRTGSFNAAASGVGVSQQAVSARVRSMEAQMGIVLMRRGPRGSQLTEDGVVVAEWAARVLEVAAEFDIGLAALRQDRRSRLRVSASLTIAEQLLPAWLVSFRTANGPNTAGSGHPTDIELTAVNSDTVLNHVQNGLADLGFVEGPRIPATVRSWVIGHDELITVVAPTHSWARRRTPLTAAELAATPLVVRERGSGTRDALDAALRRRLGDDYEQADPAISLSTTTAIRAAVLAGAGPAVLSSLAVRDDIDRGQLAEIPVDGLDGRRALRAVWIGERQPPAGAARDFIAHIAGRQRRVRSGL